MNGHSLTRGALVVFAIWNACASAAPVSVASTAKKSSTATSSGPFWSLLDEIYGVDPMFRLDDRAVKDAADVGKRGAIGIRTGVNVARDLPILFAGVAIHLIGVWALFFRRAGGRLAFEERSFMESRAKGAQGTATGGSLVRRMPLRR